MIRQYQTLGPLDAARGSKAFLGVELAGGAAGEPVVMVFVRDEVTRDAELLSKLRRETDRAVILEHPNIIRVHGLAKVDEGYARVVEYADGETLRTILEAAGKLPVSVAARIAIDAATGTHYAHLAGNDDGSPLVHGDLRPETLMVSFNGHTKVTGYGALSVAPREENGMRVVGRRQHCAPEQLLGGREMVNVATDVYLLGLLLHQCLTGKVPFADQPDPDQAIISRPLPRPEGRSVPAALFAVMEKACAKKAQQRYPSALAFRDAVEEAAGDPASHAEMANYLRQLFPLEHPQIAARRKLLEQAAATLPAPSADPEATRIISVEAPERSEAPSLTESGQHGVVRYQAPRTFSVEIPVYKKAFKWTSTVLAALVLAVGVAALWGMLFAVDRQQVAGVTAIAGPRPDPSTGQLPAAGAVPTPVAEAPVAAAPVAPAPLAPVAAAPVAPAPVAAVGEKRATPASARTGNEVKLSSATSDAIDIAVAAADPTPKKLGQLKLQVEPVVEVFLDGKSLGKSPIDEAVPVGKHALKLVSREDGISDQRTITVLAKGDTEQQIFFGKGYLTVTGPEGAEVYLDGHRIGPTPVSEHSVYEGSHKLEVKVNGASWRQSFKLRANERQSFDVHSEASE